MASFPLACETCSRCTSRTRVATRSVHVYGSRPTVGPLGLGSWLSSCGGLSWYGTRNYEPVDEEFRLPQSNRKVTTHALIIREEPLSKILAGTKTWEIRGSATKRRGRIALIQSKSGLVVGTCDLVDVVGPLG